MHMFRWWVRGLAAGLSVAAVLGPLGATEFSRGDSNADGRFDMSDGVFTLNYLFLGGPTPDCVKAADANDSGAVDIADGSYTFNFLFLGGPGPLPPAFPACGDDPSADGLPCARFTPCPQDSEPPVIANLQVTGVGQETATVSLDTSEPATAVLDYGTTTAYGTREEHTTPATSHSFSLSGLVPGTEYHFEVTVEDGFGNSASSGDRIFSTTPAPSDLADIGHVLNRITYGPTADEIARIQSIGIEAFIEEQLAPATIDESGNTALSSRENALFTDLRIHRDRPIVRPNEVWRYLKGTAAPPAGWNTVGFDDASWLVGATGIGYGDGDDLTVLDDMRRIADDPDTPEDESQPGYMSVYLRKVVNIPDVSAIDDLILRADFDDGFVGYLNGVEVARVGLAGNPPPFDAAATSHDAGTPQEFDITARRNLLVSGANVLAIQVHNTNITSSDLTMIPELINRTPDVAPPRRVIRGIDELQQLVHVRGVYSRKQLQAVLAEFWENHFTTDVEKVRDYFDNLSNSDASDAMTAAQAEREAAQAEYEEYQFFYDNALGYFGDLLVYSATSPTMTIYLDNVLNVAREPNENYAREILELFAFGVDNRYNQTDIEQLAKCFTGWTVCKVRPEDKLPFPQSARTPPTECGVLFEDFPVPGTGTGLAGSWRYFKGTEEPTPDAMGEPTLAWTEIDFDDSTWLAGTTGPNEGVGYETGTDNPVLSSSIDLDDMPGNYVTVYLRKQFTVSQADLDAVENLILAVEEYDDSYVAYVNGVPVGQSLSMDDERDEGPFYGEAPFDYNDLAEVGHERGEGADYWNLNRVRGLLRPAPQVNILALEVHNLSLGSSDLSIRARLVDRHIDPNSVENGDPTGVWTFRFDPDLHDTTTKTLFAGTPWQVNVPAGRTGISGLRDALDVVDAMVTHPSTKEFICVKLIQKLVSDQISIQNVVKLREPGLTQAQRDALVPPQLRSLLARAIEAWDSTANPGRRPGHIETVLRTLLDPDDRTDVFWQDIAYRTKVRTPIEYLNAGLRLLEASASGEDLPQRNDSMGMHLFTRDEPDGWDEVGEAWADTEQYQKRIDFNQTLAENRDSDFTWNTQAFLTRHRISTADQIIEFFADVMYHGTLSTANRDLLLEFVTTDDNGNPLPFSAGRTDYIRRVQELVGLLMSMPQWHFQ